MREENQTVTLKIFEGEVGTISNASPCVLLSPDFNPDTLDFLCCHLHYTTHFKTC